MSVSDGHESPDHLRTMSIQRRFAPARPEPEPGGGRGELGDNPTLLPEGSRLSGVTTIPTERNC